MFCIYLSSTSFMLRCLSRKDSLVDPHIWSKIPSYLWNALVLRSLHQDGQRQWQSSGSAKSSLPRAAGYLGNCGQGTCETSIPWTHISHGHLLVFWCFGVSNMPCNRPNGSVYIKRWNKLLENQILSLVQLEQQLNKNNVDTLWNLITMVGQNASPETFPDQYQSPYEFSSLLLGNRRSGHALHPAAQAEAESLQD